LKVAGTLHVQQPQKPKVFELRTAHGMCLLPWSQKSDMNPIFTIKRRYALDEIEGLGFFKSIEWVESIDSTNKQLAQSVRERSKALPALLVADRQSSGVGRGTHQWWSPDGCLMFSMAIPIETLELATSNASSEPFVTSALLPLRVGFTVAECLEHFSSSKPMVKWPNDVYLSGRKVCGVLIEVIPKQAPPLSVAIIGIGINCAVDFKAAPVVVQTNATSLHEWPRPGAVASASTEDVLVQFVHHWIAFDQRQEENPRWLLEHWPERSLLDGLWVEVKHPAGIAKGRCMGINETGAILIQNEQLEVVAVLAGTIQSYRSL
jgi:BirA family transcriptional regulator, biotin operon repressor / biotin---[acetyl-CoA-carboxylase] ligase